jgi:putative ABC transport system ATP-binding protein
MAAAVSLRPPPLVELVSVSKEYETGGTVVRAMRDVDLTIEKGEFVAIVGASGSGKSTMMNILGCLDRPTRGSYTLAGIEVGDRPGDSRAIVRNRVIGFIFQGFNLLPRTTALENVELPLQYRGVGVRDRRARARAALEAVGLGDRMHHTPHQLSGGQQQRVAIARALVTDPPLLLADEPTGNLDTRTSLDVLALLQKLNRELGITIVLVTHEADIAACAARVITMRDGRIVGDVVQGQPLDAALELGRLPVDESGPLAPAEGDVDAAGRGADSPVPLDVYAFMAGADLTGIVLCAVYAREVIGLGIARSLAVAVLVGELAMAWLGARQARRRLGAPPTADQRARMAYRYTMVVTAGALGAAIGTLALMPMRPGVALLLDPVLETADRGMMDGSVRLAAAVLAILVGTGLIRYLLLTAFNPRR